MKFVAREKRRGNRYQVILLDPPFFGRGPNREVWKVEGTVRDLLATAGNSSPTMRACCCSPCITSRLRRGCLMDDVLRGLPGAVTVGELAVPHTAAGAEKRFLPRSLFARWER